MTVKTCLYFYFLDLLSLRIIRKIENEVYKSNYQLLKIIDTSLDYFIKKKITHTNIIVQ